MDKKPLELVYPFLTEALRLSENGLAVLDKHNHFIFYNNTFAKMFGFVDQDMVGKHFDDMMRFAFTHKQGPKIEHETIEEWLELIHAHQRKSAFRRFEVDLVDGRWLQLSEQVYHNGDMVIVCTDITQLKQVEFALRNAQTELNRLALTDELTGIANRRHFFQQLEHEIKRLSRLQLPLCLVMMDIDNFKLVNDSYGHQVGDKILQHFTQFISARTRPYDIFGRLGGEEFALLLPETTVDAAQKIVMRMMSSLANEDISAIVADFQYQFSAGVSALTPVIIHHGIDNSADIADVEQVALPVETGSQCRSDAEKLVAEADKALYQAKTLGRNRVVIWDDVMLTGNKPS